MERSPGPQRITEIDGIRGWAALVVLVFHFTQQSFVYVHPEPFLPHFWLFMDGALAVNVFFILSGDAISTAYISSGNVRALDRIALNRYFRLSIPIFLSSLLTYLLMKSHLIFNKAAGDILRNGWLGNFLNFDFNFGKLMGFAWFGAYGVYPIPQDTYNTFLWTMPIELTGSFLIFMYLYLVERLKFPRVTTVFLAILSAFLTPFYGLFFIGLFLAQLRKQGTLEKARASGKVRQLSCILILLAYVCEYAVHAVPLSRIGNGNFTSDAVRFIYNHSSHILAVTLVTGVYINKKFTDFFQNRVSTFFGKISFSAYLLQFPVLCSVFSYLIVRYPAASISLPLAFGIATVCIILTIVLAELFDRCETPIRKRVGARIQLILKKV